VHQIRPKFQLSYFQGGFYKRGTDLIAQRRVQSVIRDPWAKNPDPALD
jgi:hypothetical protein